MGPKSQNPAQDEVLLSVVYLKLHRSEMSIQLEKEKKMTGWMGQVKYGLK